MDELKPCPFCGGNKMDVRTDDNGISWYIFCEDCGLMCGYALTQEDAIEAWNRRVMDDLISRQVAIKAIEDLQDCYNGFSDTYDKACIIGVLEELPSTQPTLYGYKIEHLALIARVMDKEGVSPEKAVEVFQNIVGIVQMLADEQKEIIRKAVEQWT